MTMPDNTCEPLSPAQNKARRMASYGHEQALFAFRTADPDRARDLFIDALRWYRAALEEMGVTTEVVVAPGKPEPENLAPSWDRYKRLTRLEADPAPLMVARQAAEIRAVDHPPGQVRCTVCGKVADPVLERREDGIPVPVPPKDWGTLPGIPGILCPQCVMTEDTADDGDDPGN